MVKLTFLSPVYNQAKFLPTLLDGYLNQTRKDFRVIIGDDCSTDNTQDILRSYQPKFKEAGIPLMLIRNYNNKGVQRQAKLLLRETKQVQYPDFSYDTEFTALLEGDDFCLPDRVETQLRFLEENPEWGAHHSDIIMEYEDGHIVDSFWTQLGGYPIQVPMTFDWLLMNNRIFTASFMARTDLFKTVFDYDTLIKKNIKLGDYYAFLHLTKLTKIGYTSKPLAVYRNHSSSASHSMSHEELIKATAYAREEAIKDFGGIPQQW